MTNATFNKPFRYLIILGSLLLTLCVLWLMDSFLKPTNHLPAAMHIQQVECAFEPNRTETNRIEPNRTEASRIETNITEANRVTANKLESKDLEVNKTKPKTIGFNTSAAMPPTLSWQPCQLPDNWDTTHPDQAGHAWYRFTFQAQPNDNIALYLSALSMNAEAWVNQIYLGSGGSFVEPIARNWNTPLFFQIPPSSLYLEHNTISIHVQGYANNGSGLGNVFLGDYETLHPAYWKHMLTSQSLNVAIAFVALLLSIIFLILFQATRIQSYLYFALGSAMSCIYVADVFLTYIPLAQQVWEVMAHGSLLLSQYFFLLFTLHYLQLQNTFSQWLRKFSLIHVGCSLVLMLLVAPEMVIPAAVLGHSIGLIWLILLAVLLWQRWLSKGMMLVAIFASAVSFEVVVFVYDWLPWVFGQGPTPPYLFSLGPMAFALIAASVLMVRFIASNKQAAQFRDTLKHELQQQKKQLKAKHAKLATLEQQQAIGCEQERITRELHDGLGAHLVGAKSLLEHDIHQAKQLIDDGLDELRILMDSLDNHSDLLSQLGMMRQRLQDRLQVQGIQFDWQVWNMPQHMPKNPQTIHHVLRIVQESIQNIEKHAQASEIQVFVDVSGLSIQDDGCGFEEENITHGRGLKNMQWRAEQAHATLHITSKTNHGTRIHMYWKEQ